MSNKIQLLNIEVNNLTMNETLEEISSMVNNGGFHYVVTPNVDHIVKLENDQEFKKVYKDASLVLVDGQPLIWISKLKGNPVKEKISGSDLFPKVCELSAKNGYTLFLLGAADGVAEEAARRLTGKYKGLNVVGTYSPSYGFEKDEKEVEAIIKLINEKKPDILAVGLGAPKQEKFLYKYKDQLKVPVSLAIGASIDFEAGNIKRAPKWMQSSGLEWFYRFVSEPKRLFKRYFVDDIKIIKLFFKY